MVSDSKFVNWSKSERISTSNVWISKILGVVVRKLVKVTEIVPKSSHEVIFATPV